MTDLSDIVNIFGEQNNLSGLQEWQQQGGMKNDPDFSQLAALAPRTYKEMFPQILGRQIQMGMLGLDGGNSGSSDQSSSSASTPSALSQIAQGVPLDADTALTMQNPPTLGGPQQTSQTQQSQSAPTQPNSGLAQIQQAFKLGGGDIEKGLKVLQAQRQLAIPSGIGAIPEGQQYANGQLTPIPGAVSKADQEVDKNFADSWQTYNNAGGAARVNQSLNVIDQTINALKNKNITTGGPIDRVSMEHGEPSTVGQLFDAPVLVARNQVASAILPQAKALFGSRVTNFDAQSIVNSKGLDPMADTDTNIGKLERLKSEITSGQQDLQNSGNYFQQHHTLSGYQNPSSSASQTSQTNQSNPASVPASKVYVNPQTGQRITKQNGKWVPLQ